MVIDISKIESLVKNKSKYDPTLFEVRQALIYLKVNGIDPGKISDYESLIEIINDWQNIDLKYEKTIIGEIDKITKDGVVPDKYTLDGLIANYEKYLKTKPARIKFRTHVYELAAKAVSGKVVDKFKKELVNEAIKDIKSNNPSFTNEELVSERKRLEKRVDRQFGKKDEEQKTSEKGGERVEYKADSKKLKDGYLETNNIENWVKENKLDIKKEDIEELKKGIGEAKNLKIKAEEIKGEINSNARNIVDQVENKLEIRLPNETKDVLVNDIKLSFDSEKNKVEIGDKLVSGFKEKLEIAPEKIDEIKEIFKQNYQTKSELLIDSKDVETLIREDVVSESITQKVKIDGIEKTNEYLKDLKIKDGERISEILIKNKDNLTVNTIRSGLEIQNNGTFGIIDNASLQFNKKIEPCNREISNYFNSNYDIIKNDGVKIFKENISEHLLNNPDTKNLYLELQTEFDRRIIDMAEIKRHNLLLPERTSALQSAAQDKVFDLKTEEFFYTKKDIIAIHHWSNIEKDMMEAIAAKNQDIAPYLLNKTLKFEKGINLEKIEFLQKKILAMETYSKFVKDFYNPQLWYLFGDGGGTKALIRNYEIIKKMAIKSEGIIPYNLDKIFNLESFINVIKNNKKIAFQINAGDKIARIYRRYDQMTFGLLTRTGQAKKWIAFSQRWFGETGGNFTAMWLNNFVKGAAKQTAEQGMSSFLKLLGGNLVTGIETATKTAIKTAGKEVVKTVGKTIVNEAGKVVVKTAVKAGLGETLKAAISAIGGAASGGIVAAIMTALDILKLIKKPIDKFLKSLGLDPDGLKKWFKKNLGVGPGIILGVTAAIGAFIVGLPMFLMTMATVTLATIGPIVGLVFGGIFIYQLFINQQVSSLVPPKEFVDKKESIIKEGCFVTRDGIRLRIIPINNDDICETNIDEPVCERKEEIMVYVGDKFCAASKEVCYLEKNVYEMYLQMINAAVDELKEFDKLKVSYGYRDYDGQVRIWNDYCKNDYEKSCPIDGCDTGRAACPGSSSHQSGRAIDFNFETITEGGDFYRWLKDNAYKYGFKQTISYEPWHWEYTVKLFDGEKEECEDD